MKVMHRVLLIIVQIGMCREEFVCMYVCVCGEVILGKHKVYCLVL